MEFKGTQKSDEQSPWIQDRNHLKSGRVFCLDLSRICQIYEFLAFSQQVNVYNWGDIERCPIIVVLKSFQIVSVYIKHARESPLILNFGQFRRSSKHPNGRRRITAYYMEKDNFFCLSQIKKFLH